MVVLWSWVWSVCAHHMSLLWAPLFVNFFCTFVSVGILYYPPITGNLIGGPGDSWLVSSLSHWLPYAGKWCGNTTILFLYFILFYLPLPMPMLSVSVYAYTSQLLGFFNAARQHSNIKLNSTSKSNAHLSLSFINLLHYISYFHHFNCTIYIYIYFPSFYFLWIWFPKVSRILF